MDTIGEESVRSIIRKQFLQDGTLSTPKQILDVQVISPCSIEKLDATDSRYKTLERIVEKVREHYYKPLDSPPKCQNGSTSSAGLYLQSPAVISDHWLLCVPDSLRNNERDVVNYLGMLIAIDFRHWAEVLSGLNDPTGSDSNATEAAIGMEVKGFTDFYTTVSQEDVSAMGTESQRALHVEVTLPRTTTSKRIALLRGSAAMVHLLSRAVERHNLPWYDLAYLAQFDSVEAAKEALRVCFLGCHGDAVTPLWMPSTDTRVELLLSLSQSLRARQISFYDILCACDGYIFAPSGSLSTEMNPPMDSSSSPVGFISRLLQLHPRYHDVAYHAIPPRDRRIPILKLSQLTVLALSQALPALWRFRGQSRLPLHSEDLTRNTWIRHVAAAYHNPQSGECPPLFRDMAQLSICCDYQIPRALRDAGLLVYSPRLSDLVDRGVLLQTGGKEEGAIRVGALVATELLADYLNERLTRNTMPRKSDRVHSCDGLVQANTNTVSIQALDYALWYVGRYSLHGTNSRHHLCHTIMY